LESMLK